MANGNPQPVQKDNFKRNAWIIGGSAVVLFGSWLYWYYEGRSDAEGTQVTYPPGDGELPSNWTPEALVNELHDVMEGFFDTIDSKENAFEKILNLGNPNMVRAVYNVFNQKYFKDGHGTLTQWIRDEVGLFMPNRGKVLSLFSTLNLP